MNGKKISIPLIIGGLVLVITIVGGTILFAISNASQTSNTANTTSNNTNATVTSFSGTYKDGTYSADGDYSVKDEIETIGVTLSISNGTISSVSITDKSVDPESIRYNKRFASGISSILVGKTLDQATLTGKVNGASLTPDGFNDALESIKQAAKIL